MKYKHAVSILVVVLASYSVHANEKLTEDEVRHKLDDLNAACEAARENKLAPLRAQHVEECVSGQSKERGYCERFYADYGRRSGKRAPLFLDLPECVEAFEFQKTHRER